MPMSIILDGPLSKWTNVIQGWQFRWFVLDQTIGSLSYYTSKENMQKGDRRGCIRLKDAYVGYDKEDDITFTITVDNKTFHLQARSLDEREIWVSKIEKVIRFHSTQSNGGLLKQKNKNKNPQTKQQKLPQQQQQAQTDTKNLERLEKSQQFINKEFDSCLIESDAYLQLLIDQLKSLEERKELYFENRTKPSQLGNLAQNNESNTKSSNPIEQKSYNDLEESFTFIINVTQSLVETIKHAIISLQIAKVNCNNPNSNELVQSNIEDYNELLSKIKENKLIKTTTRNETNKIKENKSVSLSSTTPTSLSNQKESDLLVNQMSESQRAKNLPIEAEKAANQKNEFQKQNSLTSSTQKRNKTKTIVPTLSYSSSDDEDQESDENSQRNSKSIGSNQSEITQTKTNKSKENKDLVNEFLNSDLNKFDDDDDDDDDDDFLRSQDDDNDSFYDALGDQVSMRSYQMDKNALSCHANNDSNKTGDDFMQTNHSHGKPNVYKEIIHHHEVISAKTGENIRQETVEKIEEITETIIQINENDETETEPAKPHEEHLNQSVSIRNEMDEFDYDADIPLEDINLDNQQSVITHLLTQVRIGMDLTKITLPTFILEPRSLLEMYADFFAHTDLFLEIPDLKSPRERMIQVVKWYLSTFHAGRKSPVAKKPYNPILGEIFQCWYDMPPSILNRTSTITKLNQSDVSDTETANQESNVSVNEGPVSWATKDQLTFIAEQVSHHPPISAFYAEHVDKRVQLSGYTWTKSKFLGLSIGVHMVGKAALSLLDYDEEYVATFPSAYGRSILTVPWFEMGGQVTVNCAKSGYSSTIEFLTKPFYGGKKHQIQGTIYGPDKKALCTIDGDWNGTMFLRTNGKTEILLSTQNTPTFKKKVRHISEQNEWESRKLWKEVTYYLRTNKIDLATEGKQKLEHKQREGERMRKQTNTKWQPKYFVEQGEHWVYTNPLAKRLGKVK